MWCFKRWSDWPGFGNTESRIKARGLCFLVQHTRGWLESTRMLLGNTWLASISRASGALLFQSLHTCSAHGSCPPTSWTMSLLQFVTWQSLPLRRPKALLQMSSYGLPCYSMIDTTAVTTVIQLSVLEITPGRHRDWLLISQPQVIVFSPM